MSGQKKVPCLDCGRPCTSAVSRARRRGDKCWRRHRREVRAAAVPVPLPSMPRRAGEQTGPDLFDDRDQAAAEADPPTEAVTRW
ncbi:DUF6011 domain-containing protein [Micromonospora chalcea]|uniref:DUF6011 domain-containing protein n=1 Tax=Micromonospora chalcea TaxID=1874 RepID=UPI0021A642C8|nr:DUF6011 domain-containing protein [Micromonospora chalcea]MCT2276339.1 DUF6011 domain-containing protein [Micromonospora chalcea]